MQQKEEAGLPMSRGSQGNRRFKGVILGVIE
jgi:hypothetical protein